MAKQIRVALIGCGGISGRHVEWFLERPECDITAVCDVSAAAAERCAAAVRAKRPDARVEQATDYAGVLARPELDAVAVLLPHSLHHAAAMAALDAGKHVLVEKPMVTTARQAAELNAAAQRAGRVLAIAYQRAVMPEYRYVRRMVETGALGAIRFVSAHLEQSWLRIVQEREGGKSWRADAERAGGGQLMDCGSHTVAALLDVTRLTPAEVFAYIDSCGLAVDVNTVMAVRFAEGALGTLAIGGFGHSVTEVLRVVGDKASARIFFRTVKEQALEVDGCAVDAAADFPRTTPNANFLDAIQGRDKVRADGDLGLRVAQLSEAAYESARRHAPVAVADITDPRR